MIPALIRKELRQLLPLIAGLAALLLWGAVDDFVLQPPDERYWSTGSVFADGGLGTWAAWSTLVLGVLTAYALLPGEHDQRTIEFLYTLPVRRRTVFLVKFCVGGGVLAGVCLLAAGIDWLGLGLNPGSFARGQLRADRLLLELALFVVFSFMVVAYGLLLAFLRRLGWLVLALAWLLLALMARIDPALRVLDVQALFTFEHHGGELIVPWAAWCLHAVLSALALVLAARLWLGGDDQLPALLERWRTHWKLRRLAVGIGLTMAALVGGVAAVGGLGRERSGGGPAARARRAVALDTRHFRFSYYPDDEDEAQLLAREADRAYQRLVERLPVAGMGRIVADLTEESSDHLGLAGWEKLRLDVRGEKSPSLLHHLLYHETAHVLAGNLSQGMAPGRDAELRFFSEGLAEWLAYELVGRTEDRRTARRIAALARARFNLRWEALLDPAAFTARHDEYLFYALGEVWVAALVERCGAPTLGRVLPALADPAGPQAVAGTRLWQQALQRLRCDLSTVVARYDQMLAGLLPEAEALPRTTATFARQDGDRLLFDLEVTAPTPGPWRAVIRVRDNPDTPRAHVVTAVFPVAAGSKQRVSVRLPSLSGRRFEYQAGASADEDTRPFLTRWLTTTLR